MDFSKRTKQCRRKPLIDVNAATVLSVDYGREQIFQMLPNREPFVFLDRITGIDLQQQAVVGRCDIPKDDPLFVGHFPGAPIYPSVLQLEMISELFCCLYYFVDGDTTQVTADRGPVQLRAIRMHDATFQQPVLPGDNVTLITKVLELMPYTYTGIGQLLSGDKVAIAVIGEFVIMD